MFTPAVHEGVYQKWLLTITEHQQTKYYTELILYLTLYQSMS